MISRNEGKASKARLVFKAIYNYLFPLMFLATIVLGILSFFGNEVVQLGNSNGMSYLSVEGEYGVYDTSGIEAESLPVTQPVYYMMLDSVDSGDLVLSGKLNTQEFNGGEASFGFVVKDKDNTNYFFGLLYDGTDNYFVYYTRSGTPGEDGPIWGVKGLPADNVDDLYVYGIEKIADEGGLYTKSDGTVSGNLTIVYQSGAFSLYSEKQLLKSWEMEIVDPVLAELEGTSDFLASQTGIAIIKAYTRHYFYVDDLMYLYGTEASEWTTNYRMSNRHLTILILFIVSVVAVTALYSVDKFITDRDNKYRLFGVALNKKFNMSNFVTIVSIALVTLIPFYILLITSLKMQVEADSATFSWFPQQGVTFSNFMKVFTDTDGLGMNLFGAIGNSFLYALIPTTIGLFMSALSAYAFAKLKFRGKELLFRLLLFTMMIPGCITMASAFVMFDTIGWTGRSVLSLPLLIPGCFGGVATMLFLKEFFSGIPDGLLEAAKIDGYGKVRCFFKIIIPLGGPALIAQFVLGFISGYNNYTAALIYLSDPAQYTMPLAISIFSSSHGISRALYSAAGVFALLPTLLLYIVFQKQILQGINLSSGLKG